MNVFKFTKARLNLGQEKYGVGAENAGWRRDNGRDVMEELHDAIVINGYWKGRSYGRPGILGKILGIVLSSLDIVLWSLLIMVWILRLLTFKDMVEEKDIKRYPPTEELK